MNLSNCPLKYRQFQKRPETFRNFVIAHKLLHLKIPNHRKLFKRMLSAHIPQWRKIKDSQTLNRKVG
ncbi:MAG: DUF45 domain-containing protein [Candidatus Mycalebacterium zealandia]|nr:MAG: DUF45 domain-containing protein [Candidatus Mycalebacterium zealandia]